MSKIVDVKAREILDSRGNPTVEVEVKTESGAIGRAAVPSGASTGAYEALEMRDGDKKRFGGKGVLNAIDNIHSKMRNHIVNSEVSEQEKLDNLMLDLDGTDNKANLGANAILGVSMACAHAAANEQNISLFKYIGGDACKLPVPLMNILNGGAHANNGLDCQEFMIAPVKFGSFKEALRAGSEIFQALKGILNDKGYSTAVGDEGGFAPNLKNNKEALEVIAQATDKAGYRLGEDIYLALDVAATELFKDGKYTWDGNQLTAQELSDEYAGWIKEFPIRSIEDGLAEDDWDGWKNMCAALDVQLVGDDLFVTNPVRLSRGIEEKAANSILIKVNQIGSLTETWRAVNMAHEAGMTTVMSHRSGETEDVTIADLAVGMAAEQIKTGSASRGERTAKYNQLLRIEEELGNKAEYWGESAFR